jgi:hypothetical protein
MSGDTPFRQTRMGQAFYERTMPALVRELARLADAMERLADRGGTSGDADHTPPDGA